MSRVDLQKEPESVDPYLLGDGHRPRHFPAGRRPVGGVHLGLDRRARVPLRHRRKAVTCAGHVHAESSDEVRFEYTRRPGDPLDGSGSVELDHALGNDLELESSRAAAEALHFRAGPPQIQEQ